MSQPAQAEFPKWRSYLWPIYSFELKKLVPMLLMMMFISFNYTIFRDTKDTLVVSTCGAQALPFLKVWGVLPGAVIFTLIYAKLSNLLKREHLFYASVVPFLVFFALFAFVLYPNREALTPVSSSATLDNIITNKGLKVLVEIYRNWILALFYIFAELWGSVCISLLFWGFANDNTRIQEAKRFYAMFGLGANVGSGIAGQIVALLANTKSDWGQALQNTLTVTLLAGVAILGLYYYIQNFVLKEPEFAPAPGEVRKKKAKPSLSIKDSISLLASSRYLTSIAILVMSYGILINICEVPWKHFLKVRYPNPSDYQNFMGHFSSIVSVTTILMMLFVGGNVIRNLGWYVGALFTPTVIVSTGVLFFLFVIFRENLSFVTEYFNIYVVSLIVGIGAIQNIMCKATKYSLFDPTKEMTYIPLDADSKTKGKAAIDVVGARLGKSGGGLILQLMLINVSKDIVACTPYLFVILLLIGAGWIRSVGILSGEFSKLNTENQQEKKLEA